MELNKTNPLKNEMETDNLIVKDGSDPYKVAGAIAGKMHCASFPGPLYILSIFTICIGFSSP